MRPISMQTNRLIKYRALFRISFKDLLTWGWEAVLSSLMLMLYAVIAIIVWIAIYSFTGVKSINGVGLTSTIIYFAIISALMPFLSWSNTVDRLSSDIRDGDIASSLIRPMSYYFKIFFEGVSGSVFNLAVSIAVIALVIHFGGLTPSVYTYAMFAFYFIIGFLMAELLGFIIGSLAIYLTDIYGIMVSINWMITIIGGGMIPLVFFPAFIEKVLLLTPFPFLAFVPAATLSGVISVGESFGLAAIGLAWLAALAIIAYVMWIKLKTRINAVGI